MTLFPNRPASYQNREHLKSAIQHYLRYTLARSYQSLTAKELLQPLSLAVRDLLIDGMLDTEARYRASDAKRLYYFSMEFLMGRTLGDNLCNLQITGLCREILLEWGVDLDQVLDYELDTGLGNGGLGRLAACFLESLATLGMPGFGYGIDYEYGLFTQEIVNGYQHEKPDRWKRRGTPFHIARHERAVVVPLYGSVEGSGDAEGNHPRKWVHDNVVIGVPHDMPIAGYGGDTVNYLRLFTAHASEEFDIEIFNRGDYIRAIERKIGSENISRVLYPSDAVKSGRELRLLQEYFLVACSVADILASYLSEHSNLEDLPAHVAIQLNDTHPALTVPELMRRLVDEHGMQWSKAWEVTQATVAYTNHTLLPEALERWPAPLLSHVLPRHMQIIYAINYEFLRKVKTFFPARPEVERSMSIIEEGNEQQVRMAQLAIVGSHSVNGVSELHSELIKKTLVPEFAAMWPERFNNKTNGVTHRRWLLKANPALAELLTQKLGSGWITDATQLRGLEKYVDDPEFLTAFAEAKKENKYNLANTIARLTGTIVDPQSMYDVQIKRFHEYKRQLLNVLRIVHDYLLLADGGIAPKSPRTYIFAGKSAPGYWEAKQTIKLIHNVGQVINNDPRVRDLIKVVFLPDYRVSLAEAIIPAADVSEQISTAGMEASGTGNMKLALNGAITVGTLDGANIEILREVGAENIYIFGAKAEELLAIKNEYKPQEIYDFDARVRRIVDTVSSNRFCPNEPGLFDWMREYFLTRRDRYFHIIDLPAYLDCSARVDNDFAGHQAWTRRAALNTARTGLFSSDRTIHEYARDIWGIQQIEKTPA